MIDKRLILVDNGDNEIGYGEKCFVHKNGILHRAFSVFIFDPETQRMLLQKRAIGKYHSGGLWTNACCSHPRKGETLKAAILRRVQEELGIEIPELDAESGNLTELGKFRYYKKFEDCSEHEIDHVFSWFTSMDGTEVTPNKNEVERLQWIGCMELQEWMWRKPEEFTAWFFPAYEMFWNNVVQKPFANLLQMPYEIQGIIRGKTGEIIR